MAIAPLKTTCASDDLFPVGTKVKAKVGDRWLDAVITKPPHPKTGNYGIRFKVGTKTTNYLASLDQLKLA